MTLIENREEQRKNFFKAHAQVRLAIADMMNDPTAITVKGISQKTTLSIGAVRNYVQDLERAGELITRRQGKSKESKILHMWLTEEAIFATYDQFLSCLHENNKARLFTLLDDKIKKEK